MKIDLTNTEITFMIFALRETNFIDESESIKDLALDIQQKLIDYIPK